MGICKIRSLVDCQETIKIRLEKIIEFCREKRYTYTVSCLENARGDIFMAIESGARKGR